MTRATCPPAQRGAAVVVALLTVALVAGIAAAAIGDFGFALEGAVSQHDRAQAAQLARGATEWARNVLAEDARSSNVDHLGEAWAMRVPPTPVDDGEVAGEIVDLSGRFNLNNLLRDGQPSPADLARFRRLLVGLGLSEGEALARAAALLDWIDADDVSSAADSAENAWYGSQSPPYRAANAALIEVGELARIRGFTPELVALLRPLVAALPAGSTVNVNTAPPAVLAALLPGLDQAAARQLVQQRERAWFKDLADFSARLPRLDETPDLAAFATTSRYFLVTGRARYGVATLRREVLFDRSQRWADIVWQRQS